jgi:hypothetical protein
MQKEYKAIETGTELKEILGGSCSPMQGRSYVIGPDIHGRICHVATCQSYGEAIRTAKEYNESKGA